MNGVLRLLGSATTTPSHPNPGPPTTPEQRQKLQPATNEFNHSRSYSNFSTPSPTISTNNSSPSSPSLNRISRKYVNLSESGWKRNSGPLNTRDELLMSLMASEAVVDSRSFDILTAEQVEDFKKVYTTLHIYNPHKLTWKSVGSSIIDFTSECYDKETRSWN